MTEELQPVRCGCGGEAIVDQTDGYDEYQVYCPKCFMSSGTFNTKAEAITAWNRAMGNRMELQTVKERTAKAEQYDWNVWFCSNCNHDIGWKDKYCRGCGARLDWSGNE